MTRRWDYPVAKCADCGKRRWSPVEVLDVSDEFSEQVNEAVRTVIDAGERVDRLHLFRCTCGNECAVVAGRSPS